MDPAGKIQDRMFWEGYKSGHMMYLRKEDLATSNDHLRSFIKKSIPPVHLLYLNKYFRTILKSKGPDASGPFFVYNLLKNNT